MATLTNKDLFFFLRNLRCTITYTEQLFDFVVQKLNINLSESENSEKIKKYLWSFCFNASTRWNKSRRILERFEKNNNSWLNKEFQIPDNVKPECSYKSACTTSLLCNKSFNEVTERHKRRRTEDLRESNPTEVLLYAAKQKLLSDGSTDMAKILDYLIKNRNEAKREIFVKIE